MADAKIESMNEAEDNEVRTTIVGEPRGPRRRGWTGPQGYLTAYMGVFLLILMCLLFTATLGSKFASWDNISGVLANIAISGIVSLGLLVPLAAGVFDVSVSGTITAACVAVAALFHATNGKMPVVVAILIVLVGSLAVGAVNAFFVVREGLDSFIITIGMGSVLLGISEWISGGQTLATGIPGGFLTLGRTYVGKIPLMLFYTAVIAAVLWYVLGYTPFGRRVYATGAGREAARLAGVRTGRIIFLSFLVSAVLAAAAGVVYAAQVGAGPPNVGAPYLLPAFSAAFLGSAIIQPGRFNVPGLIVAMLIVAIGIDGLELAGITYWIVDLFQGAALIIAIALAARGQRIVKSAAS